MKNILRLFILILMFGCQNATQNSQGENFNNNVNKVANNIIDESNKLQFFNRPHISITPKFPYDPVPPKPHFVDV